MSAKIIDGAAIANKVRSDVASEVDNLKAKGITPTLAVILEKILLLSLMLQGKQRRYTKQE